MLIDIISIFPEAVERPVNVGILGRALQEGLVEIRIHDLREFAEGRHRVTDEPPYGGGPGMLMKPEPFFRAVEQCREDGRPARIVLMTPQGRSLSHDICEEMAREEHLIVLCPRYEGLDERVRQWLVTHEISIGDYVLSGGEFAALVFVDAVGRLVPGVVGDPESISDDSFAKSRLEGPQYTRPRDCKGLHVPETLFSGDHQAVQQWQAEKSYERTRKRRPELLSEVDEEI